MSKKILSMLAIVALAGIMAMSANAKQGSGTGPTVTAQPVPTSTPIVCTVTTGLKTGKVNLRQCAGTSCGVIALLSDSDPLLIISTGAWLKVRTADNLHGYINSKYCK